MIRTITIEREFGAGAAAIAEKLAAQLGWKLWDQNLTAEIARLAQVDRASIERAAEAGNGVIVGRGATYLLRNPRKTECGAKQFLTRMAVRAAPFALLRHRTDAFHVFIYAPLEEKIRRVKASGKSEAEAIELISTIDQERATFIQKYFSKEWPTRHLYHQMINSRVGDELVVRAIINEVLDIDAHSTTQSAPHITEDAR